MSGKRLQAFGIALDRLREALAAPESDLIRDATIQRFEFCFELAWKAIQETLRDQGLDCLSPRTCLAAAFKLEWFDDEAGWLAMLGDRNLTTHTYDARLAKEVYGRLGGYLELFQVLHQALCASRGV
jgi:nucleotidyltransferase substrate binding protein (TIGR01987 family)